MTDLVPRALLDGVIRRFDPVEIWLFGSRAKGVASADSDIDLYVVIDDENAADKLNTRAVAQSRRDYRGPVDILVARRSVFERRRFTPGAMAREAAQTGVRVYAR